MSIETYKKMEVTEGNSFINVAAAATTAVKTTPGRLVGVVVNGGTMGSITIYDSLAASGTVVATIAAPLAGMVLPYGALCRTGITVVSAANTDFTVLFE